MRPDWHTTFMNITRELSKRSLCLKIKTAAIIVKNTQIIAMGYNGTFSKTTECCDKWKEVWQKRKEQIMTFKEWIISDEFKDSHRDWSAKEEIHAEANALSNISKKDSKDCILYTLYSPCDTCAKEIINYGIKHVYYRIKYSRGDGALERLKGMGVECIQIK